MIIAQSISVNAEPLCNDIVVNVVNDGTSAIITNSSIIINVDMGLPVSLLPSLPVFNSDAAAIAAGYSVYKTGPAHESMPYGIEKEVEP